jgi:hypothetical protein
MSNAKQQLEVFHNPFSNATSQPKIPDGKCVRSLGLSHQSVGEVVNREGDNFTVMHMLFYPGMDSGLVVGSCADRIGSRNYKVFGFKDAGGPDWSEWANPATNGNQQTLPDLKYAQWRVVSSGLQLSLLNAAEEDDGWWEAVRLTEPIQPRGYKMTTEENRTSRGTYGTIAPANYINGSGITGVDLTQRELANEPSYCTGLLRDLKNYQFELHGRLDHHDFRQLRDIYTVPEVDTTNVDVVINHEAEFIGAASNEVVDVITSFIDHGYDMIYIRLHCRKNDAAETASNGSQIHFNLVSNQEVQWRGDQRDARYETITSNVGLGNCSKHATLRRLRGPAAHRVM